MIFRRRVPQGSQGSGLSEALDAVSAKVRKAFELSHERLAELGAPHVLIGGLAVGVHGHPYATQDVDWLVVQESVFDGSVILTFKPGVPIRAEDVDIDYLTPDGPENVVRAMEAALNVSQKSLKTVVISSPELLVYMKLKAGRAKDIGAVVEMFRAGQIDLDEIAKFIHETEDVKTIKRFETCVAKAIEEDE